MKLTMMVILFALTGCSSAKLMRCPSAAPDNVYHCPTHVDGDYRMCHEASEDFQCVAP